MSGPLGSLAPAANCRGCGVALGPSQLACPTCGRLTHAETLASLAEEARAAEQRGDVSAALVAWRAVHERLPAGTRQATVVQETIMRLSAVADTLPATARTARPTTPWGWLVATVALVASKAKVLLLGLSKAGTFVSMLAAFGVYWTLWGWQFAAGFVGSIFVHEMGHVVALRRFGVRATAPMFMPGVGAFIRFQQRLSPIEEARTGLAGPLWGTGAALVAAAVYFASGVPVFAAIAHVGAWINLFNLLPIVPLDGGRGFRALDRAQRLALLPVIGAAWYATHEGLLALILVVAVVRGLEPTGGPRDGKTWMQFAGLVVVLAALSQVTPGVRP